MLNDLFIDEGSKIPKYKQVIDSIVSTIASGDIGIGEKIPSINAVSEEFLLSRDTVEKAYKRLVKRGIVTSVRGKGYYVSDSSARIDQKRILLVFNKLSDHKKTLYNAIMKTLGGAAHVDLQIHQSESAVLEKIIIDALGHYDHYIIMPHLRQETSAVKDAINKIPKKKLLLVNKDMQGIAGKYGCAFEDFESDIVDALRSCILKIRSFRKLVMVFPTENYYCTAIKTGFVRFCKEEDFDYEVLPDIKGRAVGEKVLYIVIEESDLVEIIKQSAANRLKLGKDIGIICYNDSPFKEILAGGISVLSTDFIKMGEAIGEMILGECQRKIKNPFKLILRNSF